MDSREKEFFFSKWNSKNSLIFHAFYEILFCHIDYLSNGTLRELPGEENKRKINIFYLWYGFYKEMPMNRIKYSYIDKQKEKTEMGPQ